MLTAAISTPRSRPTAIAIAFAEQAERPLNLKGECRGVDKCGPKWPARGPETRIGSGLKACNLVLLQHFSRVERVTGIEPALSAWEEFLSHRVSVSCNDIGGLS